MVMPFLGRLFGKGEPDDDQPPSRLENKTPSMPDKVEKQFVFKWHDPGPGNPFGIRVLDCRSLTGNVIATTKDKAVAECYNYLRGSDGRDLIGAAIEDPVRCPVFLKFPHNGAKLEGIVHKAGSMDVKWDIYVYNSVFLFARSWTGELCYRAVATIGSSEIHITEIECPRSDVKIAASHVYFLMGTHAMRRVLPHRLP
jgi:hypothetical protein